MKKLVFLFAMVFAVSMAMAQISGNVATIDQYGSNIAVIEQTGDLNEGIITQGADGSPVYNAHVPGYAGDWKEGAFIYQTGTDNDAEIDVNVSSNGSRIDQLGDYNWAKQEVNTSSTRTTDWDRMGVDINQDGNHNLANQKTVASFGTVGIQGMKINQVGDYNVADQLSIGGWGQTVEIDQIGNNNNNPTQSGNTYNVSATTLADPLNLSWAHKPSGDFTQYTYENQGVTHMYVEGNDNNTYQYQEYDIWSVSGQNDAWMDIIGSRNNVAQGQLGDLNSSEIDIEGDGNVVTSSQFGNSNMVKIGVVGNTNVVGVQQVGNLHDATVFQSGDSNFAKVIQQ